MSFELLQDENEFLDERLTHMGMVRTVQAKGLSVDSATDPFERHQGIPGHVQAVLSDSNITLVGAGGLNSLAALALVRAGARHLTIIDPDFVELTNMPRQLYYEHDLAQPKAIRLIENLQAHAIGGATLTGMVMWFQDATERFALPTDLLLVGVDRNDCRKYAAEVARRLRIPAIFTMLSADGMRCQSFLQGADRSDACLWCALPNLDPQHSMPCASAMITSCMLASAFTVFFAQRALMGWPQGIKPFNWREADLFGVAPDHLGFVQRRLECKICGKL